MLAPTIAFAVCLAACCGIRMFMPLLLLSLALGKGLWAPTPGFAWLASTPASVALLVATFAEMAAYRSPQRAQLLGTLAGPAAMVAGVLTAMAVVSIETDGVWFALALIAAGLAAGAVQGGLARLRDKPMVWLPIAERMLVLVLPLLLLWLRVSAAF